MVASAPDLSRNMAGRRLGRYEVLSQLASGGMAAVYVARARGVAGFERLVAIKVLHPHLAYEEEFISMFLDEARLAARIRHPNVVGTLDISDTEGDGFFLVMEYIEGDHLGALLTAASRAGKRLDTHIVVRLILDALGGLGAAHNLNDERGQPLKLVHRDISPHNIMVGVDGIGRLTDFGVAKAEKRLTSTRAGQFKGKLAYMAPEQASTGHADQRSDLFSMGIILWESLTGRRLFRGENNAATLNKILQEEIPLVSSLYPELECFDAVLSIALEREPDDRFQSADEFANALEAAAHNGPGIATPRAVGSIMREVLSEKIDAQKKRVRDAIERLGRSEIGEAAMPIPREGSSSAVSISGTRAPDELTVSQRPSALQVAQDPTRRSRIMAAVGAGLLLLTGGVAWTMASSNDDEASVPQPPTVSEQPTVSETEEDPPVLLEEPIELGASDEGADEDVEGTDEDEETPEVEVVRDDDRPRMRRRRDRDRDRSETSATETMEPPVMEETMTPTMVEMSAMDGMSAADDLIFNPYRR